jgi:hypothetical protein
MRTNGEAPHHVILFISLLSFIVKILLLIKSSWSISCVSWLKIISVSWTISVPIIALMMGTEMVPEISVIFNQLT